MVELWAFFNQDGDIDGYVYINPLYVKSIRDNGQEHSIVSMLDEWYVVQGSPREVMNKICEELEKL